MNELILKHIHEWTNPPYDEATQEEIRNLVQEKNIDELEDRFYKDLEFGTGGLRGIIGAGSNRMNIYTVGKATQGLANYIKNCYDSMSGTGSPSVVIARDSRKMSYEFTRTSAEILTGNGIKVYMFEDIIPTPYASYAIRVLGASAGIVITASHNPSSYNGYKVFWDHGGQIVAPHDKNIIEEVLKVTSIDDIRKQSFNKALENGEIQYIDPEICSKYIEDLEKTALRPKETSPVKIVYTPLHGTGYKVIPDMLNQFGFENLVCHKEQSIPDGDFPTVESPNPEEAAALDGAISLAQQNDADIVIATDPDADRMGIAFKQSDGSFSLINGNQIGCMLEYYLLKRASEKDLLKDGATVIKTIVTSDLQTKIAEHFNCHTEEVLTGFKWIAAKMNELENTPDRYFIFGGEESYGYLPLDYVRDKDAVSSTYFFAEMTDWLLSQGLTLQDFLNSIYIKFGLFLEDLHSLTLKGKSGSEQIAKIMDTIRSNPPARIGDLQVTQLYDYKELTVKHLETGKIDNITHIPSSNVIQFIFDDKTKVSLRPSGTEPKIKFYFSVQSDTTQDTLETDKQKIKARLENTKDLFLQMVTAI